MVGKDIVCKKKWICYNLIICIISFLGQREARGDTNVSIGFECRELKEGPSACKGNDDYINTIVLPSCSCSLIGKDLDLYLFLMMCGSCDIL